MIMQLVFQALAGNNYYGDIALDDISISRGSCPSTAGRSLPIARRYMEFTFLFTLRSDWTSIFVNCRKADPIENGAYILVEVSFYNSTTWYVPLLVDQWVLECTCNQFLWSTSVDP